MIDIAVIDITQVKRALLSGEISLENCKELFYLYSDVNINTGGRNKDILYTRLCSYRALECFYEILYNEKMPPIVRNKFGKPYFHVDGTNAISLPLFNLSHSEELVAIALYKSSEPGENAISHLGVDIQYHKNLENKAILEAKMPKNVNNTLQKSGNQEILLHFFEFSTNNKNLKIKEEFNAATLKFAHGDKECFFDKWTRVEAVIKADGRGFGAFCEAEDLLGNFNILSYKFSYKTNKFSLSLAYL